MDFQRQELPVVPVPKSGRAEARVLNPVNPTQALELGYPSPGIATEEINKPS